MKPGPRLIEVDPGSALAQVGAGAAVAVGGVGVADKEVEAEELHAASKAVGTIRRATSKRAGKSHENERY